MGRRDTALGHTMEDEDILSPNPQGCHLLACLSPGHWLALQYPHPLEDHEVLGPASLSPAHLACPEIFQHPEGWLLVAQALPGTGTLPWAGCASSCS